MEKFGVNEFEIWVDYYFITYKDDPIFIQYPEKYGMGGDVYFWVMVKIFLSRYVRVQRAYVDFYSRSK